MQEFIEKVKNLWQQKKAVDDLKEQTEEANKVLTGMKLDIVKALEAMELDKQHVPGCGTVYRQKNFSVKVPKDPQSKQLLFSWIASKKGQDVLDNMISVNSMTLNSFYKSELEAAKEEGNVDFKVPGIEVPEVYWSLGMKAK